MRIGMPAVTSATAVSPDASGPISKMRSSRIAAALSSSAALRLPLSDTSRIVRCGPGAALWTRPLSRPVVDKIARVSADCGQVDLPAIVRPVDHKNWGGSLGPDPGSGSGVSDDPLLKKLATG